MVRPKKTILKQVLLTLIEEKGKSIKAKSVEIRNASSEITRQAELQQERKKTRHIQVLELRHLNEMLKELK